MALEESVTRWIEGLRSRNEEAARQLWNRYFEKLVVLADRRLPRHVRRDFDEEDVAVSAFHSLCKGVAQGCFPEMNDRDNLWALLVVITARKASRQLRAGKAAKRGGAAHHVASDASGSEVEAGGSLLEQVIGDEPSPEFALQVSEESERLFGFLDDPSLRQLALLKMEGQSNEEIAARLACSLRTVERRLGLIRKLWIVRAEEGSDAET